MTLLTSLSKISWWQKFIILGALWLLLVSIVTGYYTKEIRSQIGAIRVEQQGLAPIQLMLDIIQRSQQHRQLTAVFLQEDPALKDGPLKKQRRAKAEALEEAIVDLEDYASKIKNSKIEKALDEITRDWHNISRHVTVRDLSPEQSLQMHKLLLEKQFAALQMILDTYQLSRDPDPAGYYLIASSLSTLPQLVEVLSQLQILGANSLAKGDADFAGRVELKALLLLGNSRAVELDAGIAKVTAANINNKNIIQQHFSQLQEQYHILSSTLQQEILSKESFSVSADNFTKLFDQAANKYYDAARFSITQIDALLKNRIEQKSQDLEAALLKITILTILLIVISFLMLRSCLRKLPKSP